MRAIALEELCDVLRENRDKRVVLTFHTIGDRDAVGSAVALSEFLHNATVVTPDFITNNGKRMLAYLNYENKIKKEFPKDPELIIVCDANNLLALGRLKEKLETSPAEILFIDHHAPHAELEISALVFNNEEYNSTASIVCDALQKLNFEVKRSTAILLLNGITADSADLQNSSPHTFSQISELLETSGMSFSFFSEYYHAGIPTQNKYQVIKDVLAAKVEVVGKYIIIYGRAAEHASVAADTALKLEADATVFWVTSNTEASISARLRSPLDKELALHLGVIMEDVGKLVEGNGGGHACAAGAYGPRRDMAQAAGEEAVRRIKEKMLTK
jgi:nanoRNase/pAp phosphatase (c-di-AMP/oligoRNAs hydrolase)